MKMELDHFFILTKPNARVGNLLLSLGLEEGFSRDHDRWSHNEARDIDG